MKYLIISDLHGASAEVEQALSFYKKFKCDGILVLGDLLNHGPRNKVPNTYSPPKVADLLNEYKSVVICVRGNCDCEADTVMFDFPCNAPYQQLFIKYKDKVQKVFLTHGHLHKFQDEGELERLALKSGDIVLSGHTHVSGVFRLDNGIINVNPGSTTIPRGESVQGFGVLSEHTAETYDLDGRALTQYELFS